MVSTDKAFANIVTSVKMDTEQNTWHMRMSHTTVGLNKQSWCPALYCFIDYLLRLDGDSAAVETRAVFCLGAVF